MLSVFAHQLILSFLIIEIGVNVHTYHIHNHRFTVNAFSTINHLTDVRYKTYFFTQTVDHFSYAINDTFQQRYLVADAHWNKDGGPIFFYTGNEGDITWFCNSTGLMWDWAAEFGAMLVFAEHRYYGQSLPYGNDSYKDVRHRGYLTSEQALADFASLIAHLRSSSPGGASSPVVAFGGSYGGMLSAWLRIKYPHMVVGALAASAPIWQFGSLVPCGVFNEIVTRDYRRAGSNCARNIRKSWGVISKMAATESTRAVLSRTLRLCKPVRSVRDVATVKEWLANVWVNLAMVDYPYAASFLEPLPAWPVKVVCTHLTEDDPSDLDLLSSVAAAINVYFNSSGNVDCFNSSQQATGDLDDKGWDFQACSEMVMPMCSDGVNDMFEPAAWNLTQYADKCREKWGVLPRPNWVIEQYGGKDLSAASNIIFSNGRLDPWSGGGVTASLSDTLVAITIADGAHHLDLRGWNPLDPPSVIAARKQEKEIVKGWIRNGQHKMIDSDVQAREVTEMHLLLTNEYSFMQNASVNAVVVFVIVIAAVAFFVHERKLRRRQQYQPVSGQKSEMRESLY